MSIQVKRSRREDALNEAVLTTPEPHVYPDAALWRKQSDTARVKVQWDPERNLNNKKLPYRSIQVGITKSLTEAYAKEWIIKIIDIKPLVRKIHNLCLVKKIDQAIALLRLECKYPVR